MLWRLCSDLRPIRANALAVVAAARVAGSWVCSSHCQTMLALREFGPRSPMPYAVNQPAERSRVVQKWSHLTVPPVYPPLVLPSCGVVLPMLYLVWAKCDSHAARMSGSSGGGQGGGVEDEAPGLVV